MNLFLPGNLKQPLFYMKAAQTRGLLYGENKAISVYSFHGTFLFPTLKTHQGLHLQSKAPALPGAGPPELWARLAWAAPAALPTGLDWLWLLTTKAAAALGVPPEALLCSRILTFIPKYFCLTLTWLSPRLYEKDIFELRTGERRSNDSVLPTKLHW